MVDSLKLLLSTSELVEIIDYNPITSYKALLYKNLKDEKLFILLIRLKFNNNFQLTSESILSEKSVHQNDVFYKYNVNIKDNDNIEIEVVYNEQLISKYRRRNIEIISETPELYYSKVLPYIESQGKVKFIQNILHNKTEKPIIENDKWIILKDYKFLNENDHYYLGVVYNDCIRSIRDLNSSNLSLLESLYQGKDELEEKYNIKGRLQVYAHYYPSFYHFHVHYVDINLVTNSNFINRAIDLLEIIENLKFDNHYYKKRTFNLSIDITHPIYKIIKNK